MKNAQLTTQRVLSGKYDKYNVRIGNDNYYTEITAFNYKDVFHCLRRFKKAFGEPSFTMIWLTAYGRDNANE